MKQLIFIATTLLSTGAVAAGLPCSIHPNKGTDDASLRALAKVSQEDAENTALKAVHGSATNVASGELEAEGGCLIYSFDINVPGNTYILEVAVDAGTGKILSQKREGPRAQAAEKSNSAHEPPGFSQRSE